MNLELYEGGTGIEVTGNTFGLNALGEPVLGSLNGIVVSRTLQNTDSADRLLRAWYLLSQRNPRQDWWGRGHEPLRLR